MAKPFTNGVFWVIKTYHDKDDDHDPDQQTPDGFSAGVVPSGKDWKSGGPLNVFDLGRDGLLIRPIKAPGQETVRKLLKQTPVGRHSPRQASAIANQALRQVRDESGRH